MSILIILTTAQADQVRGLSIKGHALAPVPLKDGTLALPVDVLNDPAHAAFATLLKTLPTRDVAPGSPPVNPGGVVTNGEIATDPAVTGKYAYNSNWVVGQPVTIK